MCNLQAALGLAQLERLDEFVSKKRFIGHQYTEMLSDRTSIELPLTKTHYAENIYWVYGIILKDSVPFEANEAMNRLSSLGVGTRPFFWCMHEQPVFSKMGLFKDEKYPVGERQARRGLYIPSGLALTVDQIQEVVEAVQKVLV
jgi:perosamine synthetase